MAADPPASRAQPVSGRAVLLALLLIPPNVYWVQYTELITGVAMATMGSLFFTAVDTLLLLVLVNLALRRHLPRLALSAGELLVVYGMVSVATAVAGHDQVQVLVTMLSYGTWYGTAENQWSELFSRYLSADWIVLDREVARGFWEGHSDAWQPAVLRAFIPPLVHWFVFAAAFYGVMLCLNLIFRPRWSEAEKLTYPLLELPLTLATQPEPLFRGRLFWLGFAIAGAIDLLNGLHALIPALPHLQTTAYDLRPHLSSQLGNALGYLPVSAYPWIIGLGYLLPKDFLLSAPIFFWLWRLENAYGVLYAQSSRFPYVNEQSFGAYLGIALFAVMMARPHLARAAREAFGRRGESRSGVAPAAVYGLLLSAVGIVVVGHVIGLSWGWSTLFFLLYFALSLGLTRMRAEMGVPAHDLMSTGPQQIATNLLGPQSLGPRNLAAMAQMWWFTRANRSHPMPHQLEALEAWQRHGGATWRAPTAIFVATMAGFVAGFLVMLHLGYRDGMGTVPTDGAYLGNTWGWLAARLTTASRPDPGVLAAVLAGGGFTLLLLRLRTLYVGWPLHPIGYAVTSYYSGAMLWLPLLLAWLIKTAVLRAGGLRLYRQLHPFFLGLILGEFVVGGGWSVVGTLTGWETYRFWAY